MDTKLEVSKMITQATKKFEQGMELAKKVGSNNHTRFAMLNLLDYFVSQINPRTIAEYQNLREKGKV